MKISVVKNKGKIVDRPYQICSRCIMDTTDPDIEFDENGVCNHCLKYDIELPKRVFRGKTAEDELKKQIAKVKNKGKKREYDCIIGVSGGVDSTYVAYLTKQLGLRPLAIHFDNGWNSELAVNNIEKVLKKLGIDLYTHVIEWEEFRNLQISFLKASTPDGEVPTDHAINALLFQMADKFDIKYIISGMNYATESTGVASWAYGHSDWKYIKNVHRQFLNTPLSNYPHFNIFNLFKWTYIKRIKSVSILNYIKYDKSEAMNILQNELGWVYYGGKHYESIYTRFYQGYILPHKFNIDKRRIHLSDLIKSGQMTREQALLDIQELGYDEEMKKEDMIFALKKLEMSEEEFDKLMKLPIKSFWNYPNNYNRVMKLKAIVNFMRDKKLYTK
jgi:N-acetyl sugar amidotransferase